MHCSEITCPQGNCLGCRDGEINCDDTRCAPYCQGCSMKEHHDYGVMILFLIVLICLGGFFLLLCVLRANSHL